MLFDNTSALIRNQYWFAALIAYTVIMIAVSLVPAGGEQTIDGSDKILHLLAYGGFTIIAARAVSARIFLSTCVAIALFGLLMEILQGQTPTRELSMADQLANTLGVVLGYFFTRRHKSRL